MRIIEEGKKRERIHTCLDCETVFAYQNGDMKWNGKYYEVICPICKEVINLPVSTFD